MRYPEFHVPTDSQLCRFRVDLQRAGSSEPHSFWCVDDVGRDLERNKWPHDPNCRRQGRIHQSHRTLLLSIALQQERWHQANLEATRCKALHDLNLDTPSRDAQAASKQAGDEHMNSRTIKDRGDALSTCSRKLRQNPKNGGTNSNSRTIIDRAAVASFACCGHCTLKTE